LNREVGELPPGSYDIEIDEEEIQATDRTAYRRVATYIYVQKSGSTRTIVVNSTDLESALQRDADRGAGYRDTKSSDAIAAATRSVK
jgi:hypothetical protein